jgi:hypothetical protein
LKYISTFFTSIAILAYFIVFLFCTLMSFSNSLPFIWLCFGVLSVFSFFFYSSWLSIHWTQLPRAQFQKKLFVSALVIRLVYVVFIYLFYQVQTGKPFEFNSNDSWGYHQTGNWILDMFLAGDMDYYFSHYLKGVSDAGWEFTLAFMYLISFRSIVIVRLINALLSAWMVVLVYRLATRNFGESAGRITAILALLLPNFIFYTGLHLKETLMVFLLVAFAERADLMVRSSKNHLQLIFQVVLAGVSLFFFRTVLAVAAWFALISALLLSDNRMIKANRKVVYGTWIILAALFFFSGRIYQEVAGYIGERNTNQTSQMKNFTFREGGNQLAKYGRTSIFIPLMLPAPLPTMVNIPGQENTMMLNGAFFTRNVYIFFVLLAMVMIVKRKIIRQHILILTLLFSYLLVLANSGFALSERFHLPAVPFLLILAGYGVTLTTKRTAVYYYIPYLIVISVIILGWNWFKLKGRGMI